MQSYDAMNKGIWIWEFRGLSGIFTSAKVNAGRRDPGRSGSGRGEAVWFDALVDLVQPHQIRAADLSGELATPAMTGEDGGARRREEPAGSGARSSDRRRRRSDEAVAARGGGGRQ